MVELYVDGNLIGVFSTEKAALNHIYDNYDFDDYTSCSVLPLGTTLVTDMVEEEEEDDG